jgi:hypothetical protein
MSVRISIHSNKGFNYDYIFYVVFSLCALFMNPVQAQFKNSGFEVGLLGGTAYDNSTDVQDSQPGLQGRILVAGPLLPFAQWEIGGGYSELRSRDSYTVMTPADMILRLSPGGMPGIFPYIFGGGGMLYYRYDKFPVGSVFEERNGWVPYVPVGAGAQLRISEGTQLRFAEPIVKCFLPMFLRL